MAGMVGVIAVEIVDVGLVGDKLVAATVKVVMVENKVESH